MSKKKDIFKSLDVVFASIVTVSKMSKINEELFDGLEDRLMRFAKACNIPEEEIENIFKEPPEEQEERKKEEERYNFLIKVLEQRRQINAFLSGMTYKTEPINPSILTNIHVKLLELQARRQNHSVLSNEKRDEIDIQINKCQVVLGYCKKELLKNPKQHVHDKIKIIEEAIDEIQKELDIS